MAGWSDLAGKIAQQFQGRIERAKNRKAVIEKELVQLGKKDSTATTAKQKAKLMVELNKINDILASSAKD